MRLRSTARATFTSAKISTAGGSSASSPRGWASLPAGRFRLRDRRESFSLDAGRAHDAAPARVLGLQVLPQLLGRSAARLGAFLVQPLDHVGIAQRLVGRGVEARD